MDQKQRIIRLDLFGFYQKTDLLDYHLNYIFIVGYKWQKGFSIEISFSFVQIIDHMCVHLNKFIQAITNRRAQRFCLVCVMARDFLFLSGVPNMTIGEIRTRRTLSMRRQKKRRKTTKKKRKKKTTIKKKKKKRKTTKKKS